MSQNPTEAFLQELAASNDPPKEKLVQDEPMMKFFTWGHLPPHLATVSKPFCDLAQRIVDTIPRNPERTVALRKLLEAKDCAVRAQL